MVLLGILRTKTYTYIVAINRESRSNLKGWSLSRLCHGKKACLGLWGGVGNVVVCDVSDISVLPCVIYSSLHKAFENIDDPT